MKIVLIIRLVLLIVLFIIAAMLIALSIRKITGRASRQEEQEPPCESCLRWDECNGVDTACPWRD